MIITAPLLIERVSTKKELSPAIKFGVIKIDSKEYIYIKSKDALVIKDFIPQYKERQKKGETWDGFVKYCNENRNVPVRVKI